MKVVKLRSVETAVDINGGTYEMEREGNNWVNKYRVSKGNDEPDYYIQDTVVEWFDSLDNYDLMKLTMWCIEHKISTPYNFR
tara:strand:- start:264 stop:509 length:246 start_codon:yes stop_codon:yes gene_type:complete